MIVLSKVSAALNPLFCHIFSATVRKGLGPTSNFTTIPPQQSTGCFFGIWAPVWVLCSMKNFELWLFIRTTKANGSIYDTSPLLAKVAAIGDACFANMEKFMVSPNVQKKTYTIIRRNNTCIFHNSGAVMLDVQPLHVQTFFVKGAIWILKAQDG